LFNTSLLKQIQGLLTPKEKSMLYARSRFFATLMTTATVLLGSSLAQAQGYEQQQYQGQGQSYPGTANQTEAMPRDLQLTIAAGVAIAPEYFGGDDYEAVFVPSVALEYHNAFLVLNRQAMMVPYEGLGYKFLSNDNFNLGLSVLYEPGRDDDSKHIRGYGEVDHTAMGGGFASYQYGPAFARAQVHMDMLDQYDGGYRGEIGAGVTGQLAPDLKGLLETTARYGSENYNEAFFNINGAQSAATGLPAYNADSGMQQWGIGGVLQYNVTPGAFVQAQAKYDAVLGDAADSPVSESNNQFYLGTNVGYQF
jgi:outer membrane protein